MAAGVDCPLCGPGTRVSELFVLSRPVLRCEHCGLVFAEPARDGRSAGQYDEAYYRGGVYADYLADRGAIHRNARRILTELETASAGRRLLDVGCATGFFLEAARARGWAVRGLELSEYAAAYARRELGLDVKTGSIGAAPATGSRFDVVTMWDIIEHLDDPRAALRNVRGMMSSRGLLVISTGDYGSLMRRLTGRSWRLFADPTHNFFFDESSLRRLLADSGFQVVNVTRRGKWVNAAMLVHQSPLPFRDRIERWLKGRARQLFVYVNPRDVMTVVATPDGSTA